MHLLVIILDKTSDLEKILHKLREIGVPGVTLLDSMGIGRNTLEAGDAPAIASLTRMLDKTQRVYNHLILSVIDDEKTLEAAINAAIEVVGDFSKPDTGIMFTVPIDRVYGSIREKGKVKEQE